MGLYWRGGLYFFRKVSRGGLYLRGGGLKLREGGGFITVSTVVSLSPHVSSFNWCFHIYIVLRTWPSQKCICFRRNLKALPKSYRFTFLARFTRFRGLGRLCRSCCTCCSSITYTLEFFLASYKTVISWTVFKVWIPFYLQGLIWNSNLFLLTLFTWSFCTAVFAYLFCHVCT